MSELEQYFKPFRENIIGSDATFDSPYGKKKIIYADWIASGRLYEPIEKKLQTQFGPYVANTHTETTLTGTLMTRAYHRSHKLIKEHVNAGPNDVIITAGYGMTAVINKLMRILSLKGCGGSNDCVKQSDRPVVFLTHMEHHSNHTSWFETLADVVMLEPTEGLRVDLDDLRAKLELYKDRKFKMGSFTACSNVTGVNTPYREMARIMHEYGGLVFIDFAASAPYMEIDMHPGDDPMEKLDAIFFSPHKFLGGPGSSGVLIFDKAMYRAEVPDNPGGGTVDWTNPWGKYKYVDDIEVREDGGTPGFLQSIKASLAIKLKEQMGVDKILAREEEQLEIALPGLRAIPGIEILANNVDQRLGVISFYHPEIHFNLFVKLLNDRYGIQTRGGCACAGTYGHFLLEVSYDQSEKITEKINHGDLTEKPGWVRWSLHPTTTNEEVRMILKAVEDIAKHHKDWVEDYVYLPKKNEFIHHSEVDHPVEDKMMEDWFKL